MFSSLLCWHGNDKHLFHLGVVKVGDVHNHNGFWSMKRCFIYILSSHRLTWMLVEATIDGGFLANEVV